jgi:hypothetical protein
MQTQPGTVPFKYNANVRNQQIPVIPSDGSAGNGNAVPTSTMSAVSNEERKHMLGEQLFPLISLLLKSKNQDDLTGKITGMILESMDYPELIQLLESQDALAMKVDEGLQVLEKHAADLRKVISGGADGQQAESSAV